MPQDPQGQRRPTDVIGAAIMVARLAAGQLSEAPTLKSGRTHSGAAGGRTKKLSSQRCSAIVNKAAKARWG